MKEITLIPGKDLLVTDTLSRAHLCDPVKEDETMLEVVHGITQCISIKTKQQRMMILSYL